MQKQDIYEIAQKADLEEKINNFDILNPIIIKQINKLSIKNSWNKEKIVKNLLENKEFKRLFIIKNQYFNQQEDIFYNYLINLPIIEPKFTRKLKNDVDKKYLYQNQIINHCQFQQLKTTKKHFYNLKPIDITTKITKNHDKNVIICHKFSNSITSSHTQLKCEEIKNQINSYCQNQTTPNPHNYLLFICDGLGFNHQPYFNHSNKIQQIQKHLETYYPQFTQYIKIINHNQLVTTLETIKNKIESKNQDDYITKELKENRILVSKYQDIEKNILLETILFDKVTNRIKNKIKFDEKQQITEIIDYFKEEQTKNIRTIIKNEDNKPIVDSITHYDKFTGISFLVQFYESKNTILNKVFVYDSITSELIYQRLWDKNKKSYRSGKTTAFDEHNPNHHNLKIKADNLVKLHLEKKKKIKSIVKTIQIN